MGGRPSGTLVDDVGSRPELSTEPLPWFLPHATATSMQIHQRTMLHTLHTVYREQIDFGGYYCRHYREQTMCGAAASAFWSKAEKMYFQMMMVMYFKDWFFRCDESFKCDRIGQERKGEKIK